MKTYKDNPDYEIKLESGKIVNLSESINEVKKHIDYKEGPDGFYDGGLSVLPISFWTIEDQMYEQAIEALILGYNEVGPGENSFAGNDDEDGPMDQYSVFWLGTTHTFLISENMGVSIHTERKFLLDSSEDECIYCGDSDTEWVSESVEDPRTEITKCNECGRTWKKHYALVGVNNYYPKESNDG